MSDRTTESIRIGTVGPTQPPADNFIRSIKRIEEKGWYSMCWPDHYMSWFPSSVWTSDLIETVERQPSPHPFFETIVTMGYAAAITDSIRLGIAATDPIRRHPITLAQAFQTLHHLSNGRSYFVLGAGERENIEPYGLDYSNQVSKLEEALEIIRRAWDTPVDETIDFDGDFWELTDAVFGLEPLEMDGIEPYPEVWLGAHGPRMLALTGKYGDGWLPTTLPPDDYEMAWDRIRESAEEAGRDPADITRGLYVNLIIDETTEECLEMMDSLLVRLHCLPMPSSAFERHGYSHPLGDDFGGMTEFVPSRLSRAEALEAAESVPIEVIKDRYVWGSPEDIIETIETYRELGAEEVTVVNQTYFASVDKVGASFGLLDDVRSHFQ